MIRLPRDENGAGFLRSETATPSGCEAGGTVFEMTFGAWTIRLATHFFGPHSAGQRVRLMVTRRVLDEKFSDAGGTDGFLAAIKSGPEWPAGYDRGYRYRP